MSIRQNEFPNLPKRLKGLGNLSENLWWSWNPGARMLFKMLDRQAWKESRHNPDKMLKELPADILATAAGDADYLRHYDVVLSQFTKYMEQKGCPLLDGTADSLAGFQRERRLHRSYYQWCLPADLDRAQNETSL